MERVTIDVNGVNFVMLPIEGGSFMMGATVEQRGEAWDNERPAHKVKVGNYYMGETVVSQALWHAVMDGSVESSSEMPMTGKSWKDWAAFLDKLSELKGAKFRMPTEAEWENAARGGMLSKGYKYSGGNNLDSLAWFDANSGSRIHPIKQKAPNELGLYDMSGNVWEWCSDWYGNYKPDGDDEVLVNPQGPKTGYQRVIRGSSNSYYSRSCRVSCRFSLEPEGKNYDNIGFRLVMDESQVQAMRQEEERRREEELRRQEEERRREEELRCQEEARRKEAERQRLETEEVQSQAEPVMPKATTTSPVETTVESASVNMVSNMVSDAPVGLVDGVDYNRKGSGWAVAAVIFTLTGGWLAIIAAITLLGNVRVNGVKYHKYQKSDRTLAIVCLILIPISIIIWNVALSE